MTKRVETPDGDWKGWNWRSEGDILVNGAFFVASGEGAEMRYEKAYSVDPKSASFIDQITFHCGVLGVGGRFGFLRYDSYYSVTLSLSFRQRYYYLNLLIFSLSNH